MYEENKFAANTAVRNTGSYPEYNENASFTISCDSYPETVNTGLSDSCKEVALLGSKDRKEHLCLVNVETGNIEYRETGDETGVGGTDFWKFINDNKDKKFSFVHNHLTDGYFSEQDMKTLLFTSNIDSFVAVRLDGVVYLTQKLDAIPRTSYFDALYEKELKDLTNQVRDGRISIGKRNRQRELIIVDHLLKDYTRGLVEYDT